jgi:GNAT superfamily N-acetyltransferase
VKVVAVSDRAGRILDPQLLAASEEVHRQLRPHLPQGEGYIQRMKEVFAGGAEMAVVVVDGKVAGVTVYRMLERTFSGRELYCDDLVTDNRQRSTGVGRAMMEYMNQLARERDCDTFALDSGCQRQQAHKFYFREKLTITSFHFTRVLKGPPLSERVKI